MSEEDKKENAEKKSESEHGFSQKLSNKSPSTSQEPSTTKTKETGAENSELYVVEKKNYIDPYKNYHRDEIPGRRKSSMEESPPSEPSGQWSSVEITGPKVLRQQQTTVIIYPTRDGSVALVNAQEIFRDVMERHNFVIRVYTILALMIGVTCIFPIIVKCVPAIGKFLREYWYLVFVAIVVDMVLMFLINFIPVINRKSPYNIIFLTLLSISHSFFVGFICALYDINEILISLAVTITIIFALTLFAFQTRFDFTRCAPYIMVIALVTLIVVIFCAIFNNRILHIIVCGVVVLVLCVVIVLDTQLLLGGKRHLIAYSTRDYTFGAMQLYIDFCLLFVVIISCQGNMCSN